MIEQAEVHDKQVTGDLVEITKGSPATVSYDQRDDEGNVRNSLEFRIKGQDSLSRKLKEDSEYDVDKLDGTSRSVYDVLRFTAMVNNPDMLVRSFNMIKLNLEQRGYTMLRCRNTLNTFNHKNPYRGINTIIKTKDGYKFELQFHTPESLRIKEENHILYKKLSSQNSDEVNQRYIDKMYKNSVTMKSIKDSGTIDSFDNLRRKK